MTRPMIFTAALLAVTILVATAMAQRGVGQKQGVARQPVKPAVQTIVGTLKEIKTGPCEHTTGRSPIGTHLILQAEKATYNLHLGPASEVKDVVATVRVGDKVEATAFRTERLPEDQYIAVAVKSGDKEIVLRDNSLRPRWAGGGGARAGRGRRLVSTRALGQSSQIGLSDEQVAKIEGILANAEKQIRDVLTEPQLNALDSRPRGGQGRGRGPRWAER